MDVTYLLNTYRMDETKLLNFGFEKKDNCYLFRKNLDQDLYALFILNEDSFNIRVLDQELEEEYILFEIQRENNSVKEKVFCILEAILASCFSKSEVKNQVIEYLLKTYHPLMERPWEDAQEHITFKESNSKKWFALMMHITLKQLGFNSTAPCDAINLKLNPSKIVQLIDGKHYFEAYHMNKKYWMTVLLDEQTNMDELKELIAESYQLVLEKNRRKK